MNYIIKIFIFLIILLLYLHINNFLTYNNSLIVNELYYKTKIEYNKICDINLPLIIYNIPEKKKFDIELNELLDNKINFKIYNNNTYINYINLLEKMKNDNSCNYISLFNYNNLKDNSNIYNLFYNNDFYLSPDNYLIAKYNIIIGNINSDKYFIKNIYYRNIFYISEGCINIKLIMPKDSKNIKFNKDISNENLICIDSYSNEFHNINYKIITLNKGDTLVVPYSWVYLIEFNKYSKIINLNYINFINLICNSDIFLLNKLNELKKYYLV